MGLFKEGMLKQDALKDKVILVTGGGTGLGKSMTGYFLQLGSQVVISSRKEEVLNQAAKELGHTVGKEPVAIPCDVTDYKQVEELRNAIIAKCGRIDAVVNNAAGNFISPTERLSHRAFDIVVDIVLRGTYNTTLVFGKHWIESKMAGAMLNIVTTYAWTGSGYVVPSACAKAGVLALTRSLAVEWAKYNIRFNAIAPGPFPTEGAWKRLFPEELIKKIDPVHRIPLGRVGDHQELANLAAYLISDYSAFINGEVVTIDGGEWLKGAGEFNSMEVVSDEMWDALAAARSKAKPS